MRRLFAAVAAAGLLVSSVALADEIADRRAMMKEKNGASMGVLVKVVKGEMAYDPDAVLAAFTTMREGTEGFTDLFPEGTETGGDTIASPKIWEDKAGFDAKFAEFQADLDAAIAAQPASLEEFQPLFQEVGGNCQSCHEMFRLKRE